MWYPAASRAFKHLPSSSAVAEARGPKWSYPPCSRSMKLKRTSRRRAQEKNRRTRNMWYLASTALLFPRSDIIAWRCLGLSRPASTQKAVKAVNHPHPRVHQRNTVPFRGLQSESRPPPSGLKVKVFRVYLCLSATFRRDCGVPRMAPSDLLPGALATRHG